MVALSTHCSGGICSIPMHISLRNITTFCSPFYASSSSPCCGFRPKVRRPTPRANEQSGQKEPLKSRSYLFLSMIAVTRRLELRNKTGDNKRIDKRTNSSLHSICLQMNMTEILCDT